MKPESRIWNQLVKLLAVADPMFLIVLCNVAGTPCVTVVGLAFEITVRSGALTVAPVVTPVRLSALSSP